MSGKRVEGNELKILAHLLPTIEAVPVIRIKITPTVIPLMKYCIPVLLVPEPFPCWRTSFFIRIRFNMNTAKNIKEADATFTSNE